MRFLSRLFWSPRVGEKVLVKTHGDDGDPWTGYSSIEVVEAVSHKRFKTWYGFRLREPDFDTGELRPNSWLSWFGKDRVRRVEVAEVLEPANRST